MNGSRPAGSKARRGGTSGRASGEDYDADYLGQEGDETGIDRRNGPSGLNSQRNGNKARGVVGIGEDNASPNSRRNLAKAGKSGSRINARSPNRKGIP